MADWTDAVAAYTRGLMDKVKTPGLSMGLAQDGRTIYAQGFGFRDAERELPADPETLYPIASVTKSFTAVAVMQLQERGLLRVDDPVVKYLPEFRLRDAAHARSIRIEHLLSNTSGLPPLVSLYGSLRRSIDADPNASRFMLPERLPELPYLETCEDLMDFIAEEADAPLGPPGSVFSYSNDGFALLGAVIERVSGMPYPHYVTQNILVPAGMTHSGFDPRWAERQPGATQLYHMAINPPELIAAPGWWDAPAMTAAGFLKSTVTDMLRYLEIYRTGGVVDGERILSPESVRAMTTPRIPCGPNMGYAYGLMITPYQGMTLVEHGGNLKGAASWMTCIPERGLTGVVLSNLIITPAARIILGALNARLGLPLEANRFEDRDHPCPPDQLARYEGRYPSAEGVVLTVRAEDDGLVLQLLGNEVKARCIGEHLFAFEQYGDLATVRFVPGPDGSIWGVLSGFRLIRKAGDTAATEVAATHG
ncbi:MAG TPA: serine hydrolase [Bacillota bacterium]